MTSASVADWRILIITPAKDEARYIGWTIRSMAAQTHRPALWIIVDDGSTDGMGHIVDEAAARYPWIRVVHRPQGIVRRVGPGVIDAFYAGLAHADLENYDFVCKLDGDIEFAPNYFADLLAQFAKNPRLGTASGKCYTPLGNAPDPEQKKFTLERIRDDISIGPIKLYRRECFEEIGGFVREAMWDGIDCHRCRQLGWQAVSYPNPELAVIHLRIMGSSFRSIYHGRLRWGRGQYFMGTHPLYLAAVAVYRMAERPWILGGLCILLGYLGAWIRRAPQFDDPEFRQHLHRWQLDELKKLILRRRRQGCSAPRTLRGVDLPPIELGDADIDREPAVDDGQLVAVHEDS